MPSPPSFKKLMAGDSPVNRIYLSSSTVPLSTVHDYAETVLQKQLSQLPGVAESTSTAGRSLRYASRSTRRQPPPRRFSRRGAQCHRQGQLERSCQDPRGASPEPHAGGDRTARTGRGLPQPSGRLAQWRSDKARRNCPYRRRRREHRNGAWDHNDQPYVGIAVYRQPDANLVEIAAAVRAMLPACVPRSRLRSTSSCERISRSRSGRRCGTCRRHC